MKKINKKAKKVTKQEAAVDAADYVVAIPSHRRPLGFRDKTLAYLGRTNVPLSRVHLFLSDDEDVRSYAEAIDEITDNVLTVHKCEEAKNATDKFNAIHNSFKPGTKVFVMEDDVQLLESPAKGSNEKWELTELDALIRRGFEAIPEGGLWGIAPHDNGLFMSEKVTRSLKLVVAHAFGFVSTNDARLAVQGPSKTDYERTLRYFVHFGEVVRLDWIGVRTTSYTAEGGMQADHSEDERARLERLACLNLVRRYPHLISLNVKKKSRFMELSFKRVSYSPIQLQLMQRKLDTQFEAGVR